MAKLHPVKQQQLQFEQRVDDRIEALLARCDRLQRGSDLHVLFDERGEREARRIADHDSNPGPGAGHSPQSKGSTMSNHDWNEVAQEEAARLQREHDAGWDLACERMVDELAAESPDAPTTWEEAADRAAAKLRTERTDFV